jgi:hypothetical protein
MFDFVLILGKNHSLVSYITFLCSHKHTRTHPSSQRDAIDVEVARQLAAQQVRIKCKRLEAGVYWINKSLKTYVRLIRDRLLVRVGGGWEDFAAFVKHHESAAFAPLVVYAQPI